MVDAGVLGLQAEADRLPDGRVVVHDQRRPGGGRIERVVAGREVEEPAEEQVGVDPAAQLPVAPDRLHGDFFSDLLDHRCYWGDVVRRVRLGESLRSARHEEAVRRNGPLAITYYNGIPCPTRDLDTWLPD